MHSIPDQDKHKFGLYESSFSHHHQLKHMFSKYNYFATSNASIYKHGFRPFDSGLFILSRYPIIYSDHLVFKQAAKADSWSTKGALCALIQIEEHVHILVVTVHLQADYHDRGNQYLELQVQQARELREFVFAKQRKFKHLINATVCLGDFNVDGIHACRKNNFDLFNGITSPRYDSLFAALNECFQYTSSNNNARTKTRKLHWIDVGYEFLKHHPVTFGNIEKDEKTGEITPTEPVLTETYCTTDQTALDYLFYIPADHIVSSVNKVSKEELQRIAKEHLQNLKLEKFQVENQPFRHLSDHYGLSVELKVPRFAHASEYLPLKMITCAKKIKSQRIPGINLILPMNFTTLLVALVLVIAVLAIMWY